MMIDFMEQIMSQLRAMQTEAVDRGTLQINVTSSVNAFPVERAEISISYTGVPESTLEKIQTDSSGQTETIELAAPPEEWSLDIEEDRQPYSEYTLSIKAPGFEPVNVAGTEILANVKAIQKIQMKPADASVHFSGSQDDPVTNCFFQLGKCVDDGLIFYPDSRISGQNDHINPHVSRLFCIFHRGTAS